MGQNRRARRKAGAEQKDAEERLKRFEAFIRQVCREGDSSIGAYAKTYGEVVLDGERTKDREGTN